MLTLLCVNRAAGVHHERSWGKDPRRNRRVDAKTDPENAERIHCSVVIMVYLESEYKKKQNNNSDVPPMSASLNISSLHFTTSVSPEI